MRKLILASSSLWRKEILEKSGIPFVVEKSDFEEDMTQNVPPKKLAQMLAEGKAETVAIRHADAVVIGADTFVEFEGQVLGKPLTQARAKRALAMLSGKTHKVHTGYCIIDTKTGSRKIGVVTTRVTFRVLSSREIDSYVATAEPLDAAGSYTIQTGAASFVKNISGDFYNVVGLPLATIVEKLKEYGVEVA